MTQQRQRVFDFDHWLALARDDPAAFEAERRALIEALIDRAPPARQRRLRGLQFRIDMERRRARTPMAACIRIQSLMWDSLVGPDGLYDRVSSLNVPSLHSVPRAPAPEDSLRPCATIIPFPGAGKSDSQ
jgi:hypothetical protein